MNAQICLIIVLEEQARLSYLSFRNVSYSLNGRIILDTVSFDVARGETLVLLGRSGSGKTTVLRLINRMLEPTSGKILIDGVDIGSLDPIRLRRGIGYVIQEFGLLPHWRVEQNVELVPRLLGWPMEKRRKRTKELLHQVGLQTESMQSRFPNQLSGGQRQRVAVARALAAEPSLLLLDEPFGALDPITRHEMQKQFADLRVNYNVTSIFVTHDLMEALLLADKIGVLDQGRLAAFSSPERLFESTAPIVRAFLDTLPSEIRKTNARTVS